MLLRVSRSCGSFGSISISLVPYNCDAMKNLIFILLITSLPLLAIERSYETATLARIDIDIPNTTSESRRTENVFFTLKLGDTSYTADCGTLHKYKEHEWRIGADICVRFNSKGDRIWIKRPNGKEQNCWITEKR